MYRIDSSGSVNGHFSDGNDLAGIEATIVPAVWLNNVQEELLSILAAGGIQPNSATITQVLDSLRKLFVQKGATDNVIGVEWLETAKLKLIIDGTDQGQVATEAWASAQVAAETLARTQAVTAEAQARASADGSLGQRVTDETNARAAADAALDARFAAYAQLAQFGAYGGGSGYQRLPSGIVIQWGSVNTSAGYGDYINFPIAFPTAALAVVACEGAALGWGLPVSPTIIGVQPFNKATFRISTVQIAGGAANYQAPITVNFLAVGI